MVVTFTKHAIIRLKERGLSAEVVKDILIYPVKIEHQAGDKFAYYGRYKEKTVVIITERRRDHFTVITIFYENYL